MNLSAHRASFVPRIVLSAVALIATFASVNQSQAQQGRRMVVNETDDGGPGGPQIMMFSTVDFFALREPDFIKKDVPTFTEQLLLSEPQTSQFEQMIEKYLADFEKLCEEMLPKMPGQVLRLGGGGGPDVEVQGGPGGDEGGEGEFVFAPAMMSGPMDGGEEGEVDLDPMLSEMEGDFSGGMAIGVQVAVGGPDDGGGGGVDGEGGGAQARDGGVSISIAPSNGEEISEEDRQRLQEQAQKIAEKIRKDMEERAAAGEQGAGAGPMFREFDPEQMQRDHEEMEAKAEEFRKAKASLRQKYVTEAQSQLAGSQVERWPNLERTLRRHKTLPKGRLSGERTDLVRVLKDMKLAEGEQQAVASQSDAYELAMENALVQRNTNLPEFEKQMDQSMQKGEDDKALTALERATALRIAVRTINEQFTDTIAAALPGDMAAAFRKEVLRKSYPNVYRKTYGQKNFDAAKKIEGLDPKTLASIQQLETGYHAELEGVNAQLKSTIDKHQPDEPRWPIEHMKAMRAGEVQPGDGGIHFDRGSNPIREAFTKRRELDQRYAKMVREMLTPEQQEALPKPISKRAGEPIIIEMPAREQ